MEASVFSTLFGRFTDITEFGEIANCIAVFRLKTNFEPDKRISIFYIAFHKANSGLDDIDNFLNFLVYSLSLPPAPEVTKGMEYMKLSQRIVDQEYAIVEIEVKFVDPNYKQPPLEQNLQNFLLCLNLGRGQEGKPPIR